MKQTLAVITVLIYGWSGSLIAQVVIDHFCTDAGAISSGSVELAKAQYRVWYGHTSHGSQITSGMTVLAGEQPTLYNYNSSGSGGALSYQETGGDLGHNGDLAWEVATRAQLDQPGNDRNLVMWSWCGGASDNTVEGINIYLNAMSQLEIDYPGVLFIYMTGHLDGTGESGNLHQRNNQIRQYCQDNSKVLFDFADIESFDPDNNYYLDLDANDNCDYWVGGTQHNWAIEWCQANPGQCSSVSCAHSQSLNCDRKGVAFWWLLAQLAEGPACIDAPANPSAELLTGTQTIQVNWESPGLVDSYIIQRQVSGGSWDQNYATTLGTTTVFNDIGLSDGTYAYRVVAHLNDDGTGLPCDSRPSGTVTAIIATQPPASPDGLTGIYGAGGVQLNWTDQSNNEEGFTIQRSINSSSFLNVMNVNQNVESWTDADVTPLTIVTYRVFAWNPNGNSGYSNEVTVHIPEETLTLHMENTDDVDDSFLDPNAPDTAFGDEPYVSETHHFAIRFNLPESLNQKTILDARIAFYGWNQSNWQPGQTLDLYRVAGYWEEPTVTWNQACECRVWDQPGGDYDTGTLIGQTEITEGCDHCFYPEIDVTDMVQSWVDGCIDNDGFMLVNDSITQTSLKASEYSTGQRSYLHVEYSNETHVIQGLFNQVAICWCNMPMYNPDYDLDGDLIISILDLLLIEEGCAM